MITMIERLLQPRTIAFVGLSDNASFTTSAVSATFASDARVFIVNPLHASVMGRPTVARLADIDGPVDCVMSLMQAERSVELAEAAADLDVGGMVFVAGGFAETGPDGAALQGRLRSAADSGGFAVLGPNCIGFENVAKRIRPMLTSDQQLEAGGLSIVSHSGAMLTGVTIAGRAAGVGFNLLISAGNEAVTDMADYVGYLADDPGTKAIGLVIETIRRPEKFFAAVRKAVDGGKPIVAVKLGRSERTQRMAASHTGALTGDVWIYDVALRQQGVTLAYDLEELVDRLALVEKIPAARWTPVQALGIVTSSGGFSSIACDVAGQEGVEIHPFDESLPWVQQRIPGVQVPNPLDVPLTAAPHWRDIMDHYITATELDACFVLQPMLTESDALRTWIRDIAENAAKVAKPVVLADVSELPPAWIREFEGDALAYGRGVRPSLRGLHTIGAFTRFRERLRPEVEPAGPVPRPSVPLVEDDVGQMLPFGATMELLRSAGVPVAPYTLLATGAEADEVEPAFTEPYVVKLADVAHRTEHDAVRIGVTRGELAASVRELREIARAAALPSAVVIQPQIPSAGEVLIGVQGLAELGPVVVLGLGGIFAEALHRVGGRMAPFDIEEARDLIEEFRDVKIMHGFRGRAGWDLEALAGILVNVSHLACGGRDWIASLDLNPVLYGNRGWSAVDAVLFVQPSR